MNEKSSKLSRRAFLLSVGAGGAAGAAALVAKHFGVPKRAVTIIAGETARLKRLHVAGDPHILARIAQALYGSAS